MLYDKKHRLPIYYNRVDGNMFPVSIQAGIIDKCFNKCFMCGHPDRVPHKVDVKDWIKFLTIGKSRGLESVCYSGGDPMANRDMNEIMDWHINNDVSFGIITSGFIPKYIDINKLKHATWVRVSLDSINENDYNVCRPGLKLEKVVDGIEHLLDNDVYTEFGITVSDNNINSLMETFDYALSMGISVSVHPVYIDNYKFNKADYLIQAYKEKFDKADLFLNDYNFTGKDEINFDKCKAIYYQSFIDAKGDIYPCCMTANDSGSEPKSDPIGNISDIPAYIKNREIVGEMDINGISEACETCAGRLCKINNFCASYTKVNTFF